MTQENPQIALILSQVEEALRNKDIVATLISITFKGLTPETMKRAMVEGIMRGFTFRDFLEKNVYAIPFKNGYSLVTSIDYARKIGMRSGIVGKNAPVYEETEGKLITCSVTVQKKIGEYVGDFTATIYVSEYDTGMNLWVSKKRTMAAKTAEMHALRMACPEELSQSYIEEELEKEVPKPVVLDMKALQTKIESVESLDDLKRVWSALPPEAKTELEAIKDKKKFLLSPIP